MGFVRDFAWALLAAIAVWLIRALLRSVRDGDPFTGRNVTRLRALACVVLVGVLFATYFASLANSELADRTGFLEGGPLRLDLSGNVLVGGLALFVLAEVFSAGVRMRDDLEGTV